MSPDASTQVFSTKEGSKMHMAMKVTCHMLFAQAVVSLMHVDDPSKDHQMDQVRQKLIFAWNGRPDVQSYQIA